MGFLQFWLSKIKLLLASMKSLTNCEILTVTRKLSVILKSVSKAGDECTWEKLDQGEQMKAKPEHKFFATSGTIFLSLYTVTVSNKIQQKL
jgi:hypothetical protein